MEAKGGLTVKSRRDFIKKTAGGIVAFAAGLGRGFSPLRDGSSAGRTNLLFIITDQQTYNTLSCAGNRVIRTPHLDRLAREGVFFERAYSNNPVCVPTRSVILTGHSTLTLGVRKNSDYDSPAVADLPTFDSILAGRGYKAEYHGKWHAPYRFARAYENFVRQNGQHTPDGALSERKAYLAWLDRYCPWRYPAYGELEDCISRRPYVPDPMDWRYGLTPEKCQAYADDSGEYGNLQIPCMGTRTAFTGGEALEALDRLKDAPFSLTCSFAAPHPPMVLPEPYYGLFPPDLCDPPSSIKDPMQNCPYAKLASKELMRRYRNGKKVRYMISDYYGLVREVDFHVGKLLRRLDELGLKEKTLVVFTSDHGEMLGAHGMHSKRIFFEESVHIPLIMRLPGVIPAGIRVSHPVSHIDLFATICDYLKTGPRNSEGHSLRPLIEGRFFPGPDFCVSEHPSSGLPVFMVRTGRWKFLFADSPGHGALDALYDLEADPREMINLIGRNPDRGRYFVQAEEMKERLLNWLKSIDSPLYQSVKERPVITDEPPAVTILSPLDGAVVESLSPVEVNVKNEIGIENVEFQMDGKTKRIASSPPYSWNLRPRLYSSGPHRLKVLARDVIGQTGHGEIRVTVRHNLTGQRGGQIKQDNPPSENIESE